MTRHVEFELHPQLERDCIVLGQYDLSLLLLMNDARYPWCILVPRRAAVREIYELAPQEQMTLMRESCELAAGMAAAFGADKMNVAALGNMVEQLHVHHVVRRRGDAAWPAPVWGRGEAQPYDEVGLAGVLTAIRPALGDDFDFTYEARR